MAATKSIVADLNKGDKLTDKNYDIWHRKIQYLLEQDMLQTMRNDLMLRFKKYRSAKALWDTVKLQLGGTSATRLRQLILNFDRFVKRPHTSMRQRLTMMANMISELGEAGHVLTYEQVQVVIRSLPPLWEHMRVNLTHNENIITFDDFSRRVELEEDRLLAEKRNSEANVAHSQKSKTSGYDGYKGKGKSSKKGKKDVPGPKNTHHKRGKRGGKKDTAQMACFKCNKLGHFALECTKAEARCSLCNAEIEAGALIPNHALRAAAAAVKHEDDRRLFHNAALRKRRKEVGEQGEAPKRLNKENGDMSTEGDCSRLQKGVQYPFSVNEKVIIKGNRRTPDKFVGREAVITSQCLNGWYLLKLLDTGESVRLQYRSLHKIRSSQGNERLQPQPQLITNS